MRREEIPFSRSWTKACRKSYQVAGTRRSCCTSCGFGTLFRVFREKPVERRKIDFKSKKKKNNFNREFRFSIHHHFWTVATPFTIPIVHSERLSRPFLFVLYFAKDRWLYGFLWFEFFLCVCHGKMFYVIMNEYLNEFIYVQTIRLITYLDIYIYTTKYSVKYFILLQVFHITSSEHIFISFIHFKCHTF